jgi:hypothetical protein
MASLGPITPPSLSVPYWYGSRQNSISGACASDSNSCTSPTCGAVGSGIGPCLHLWQQLVYRYGTDRPTFTNVLPTWTLLDDEEADDTYTISPTVTSTVSGFYGPTIQCTVAPYVTGAAIASYSAAVRTSSPALPTITVTGIDWSTACVGSGSTGGADSCVGASVLDTTSSVQFWIAADMGSGVARISQQFSAPVVPVTPIKAPTVGDLITIGRPENFYATGITTPSTSSIVTVNNCTLFNGAPGSSMYAGPRTALNACATGASQILIVQPGATGQVSSYMQSCYERSDAYVFGASFLMGGVYAGDTYIGSSVSAFADADPQFTGVWFIVGEANLESVYVGQQNAWQHTHQQAAIMYHNPVYSSEPTLWWGPGAVVASWGAHVIVDSSSIFSWENNVVTTGQMSFEQGLDTQTTGCAWNLTTGVPTCNITLNQTNIQTNGGLVNPVTGSAYLMN